MGDSRKYPHPTRDGFQVLNPPPPHLTFGNSRMHYPPSPCPQNSKIVNYSDWNFRLFWKYIFDLAMPIRTEELECMPSQGCDLVAPDNKLYSSVTKKPTVSGLAVQSPFKSDFGYKNKHHLW